MSPQHLVTVSSTTNSATILQKAADLAIKLSLPHIKSNENILTEYALIYSPIGLQLMHIPPGNQKWSTVLYVDFVQGKNRFRRATNCTIKQPIARAAGIKTGLRPTVLDATAGLGSDAFVLASLGCQVTMCERSSVLSALLEDGLRRGQKDKQTAEIIERLNLVATDAKDYLLTTPETFHTIYLDPMYPHRDQSALSKMTLRTIRTLVGADTDSGSLLDTAFQKALNRVVVKRPLRAPLLSDLQPSHAIYMKKSRFDIYLTFKS